MPTLIKKILGHILSRIKPSRALKYQLHTILRNAYAENKINVVYDIGAHRGRWTREMIDLMPKAEFILFEANPDHEHYLKDLNKPLFISVLTSKEVNNIEFYTRDDDAGSTGGSVYKEKTSQYQDVIARDLPTAKLSTISKKNKLPQPDFIKIDTQGAELDVIQSGIDIFRNANYILMELPVLEYNDGAPSFDSCMNQLLDIGFLPISTPEIHKFNSVIIQIDFLFINKRLIDRETLTGLKIK